MATQKTFYYGNRTGILLLLAYGGPFTLKLFTAPADLADAMVDTDFTWCSFNGSTPVVLTGGTVLPGNPFGLATLIWDNVTFTKGAGGASETAVGAAIVDSTGAPVLAQIFDTPKAFNNTGDYLTVRPRYFQGDGTPPVPFTIYRWTGDGSGDGWPESAYVFGDGGGGGGGGGGPGDAARWYKFLEGAGTTLADSVSGADGTIDGTYAWSADSPTSGKSLIFEAGGKVTVPHIVPVGDFTVFGRCKMDPANSWLWILGWSGVSDYGWGFGPRPNFSQAKIVNNHDGNVGATFTFDTAWHSFACSVSSAGGPTIASIYVDGVFVTDGVITVDADSTPSADWWIGNTPLGGGVGGITDVRYFTTALDATTIAAVHADTTL